MALEISYISQMLANRRYFPDFVIRDYKGRSATLWLKNKRENGERSLFFVSYRYALKLD